MPPGVVPKYAHTDEGVTFALASEEASSVGESVKVEADTGAQAGLSPPRSVVRSARAKHPLRSASQYWPLAGSGVPGAGAPFVFPSMNRFEAFVFRCAPQKPTPEPAKVSSSNPLG